MERETKGNILIIITNIFAAINVIHSGLLKKLEEEYTVLIMSDVITHRDAGHLNAHFQTTMQLIPTPIPHVDKPVRWLRISQKLLFYSFFKIETLDIKMMQRSRLLRRIILTISENHTILHLIRLVLILTRKILIRLLTRPQRYSILSRHRFLGVISTSPLDIRENEVVNSLKIKKAPIVISWDNLTSKGLINADHDLIIVWNSSMADEYRRFYSIFGINGQIRITGIPRFDIYFREKSCAPQRQLIVRPEEKIILFATSATRHIACQRYILEHLIEYASTKSNLVIWVRCHPGDDQAAYQQFAHIPNLHLISPFQDSLFNGRIPPPDFLQSLEAQLRACHVCVQIASTMRLDAAACDKPVISVVYDARDNSHHRSAARLYDYSHQVRLNNLRIDHRVHTRQELFRCLNDILSAPDGTPDYKNSITAFIHHAKPVSTELTKQFIYRWLS
nr:CDP-glycerol glycerophosphotransferase family protein [uncultured Dyadobacter sp.]